MIGENIKRLRTEKGMTQKELADKLFVTAQAVSRWENGEVEPSVSTISEIAKIFCVSTDEMLGVDAVKAEPKVIVEKEVVYKDAPKQPVAMCSKCKSFIYDNAGVYKQVEGNETVTLCKKCHEEKKAEQKRKETEKLASAKKRRIHSFVWGSIGFTAFLIAGIVLGDLFIALGAVAGVLAFTYISCMILKNTFIPDLTETICNWGWVRFPGLIFELSLDGIIWLLTVKLAFWIIGFMLAAAFTVLAVAIGSVLSLFTYPYAIVKSFRKPLEFDEF